MKGTGAKTVSAVKEEAERLFSRGSLTEALTAYESIESHGDDDPRILLRMGDIARRLGDMGRAIGYYGRASEAFSALGFTIKAIAVCKIITNIDPDAEGARTRLAELHGMIAGGGGVAGGDEGSGAVRGGPEDDDPGPDISVPQGSGRAKAADGGGPRETGGVISPDELPRTPLFSDFTEEEFLDVVRKVRARLLPAGEFLFREGDPGDSIFFVSEGRLDVVGRARDGGEASYAALTGGEVFGEFGFFHNTRRCAGVRAAVDSELLELTRADLDEIITAHERVSETLFEFYKERVVDRLMALSVIFAPMTPEDRGEVINRATVARFGAGETIVAQGDRASEMYLIKSGHVAVSVKGAAGGEDTEITTLEPGDFFGEIALALGRPRVATVRAQTGVELIVFARPVIKDILERYGSIKGLLERVVKERVVDVIKARGAVPGHLV